MNKFTRIVVDETFKWATAFRDHAGDTTKSFDDGSSDLLWIVAQAAATVLEDPTWDKLNFCGRWVAEGATVISITLEQARIMTELPSPEAATGWPFPFSALVLDIGVVGTLVALHDISSAQAIADSPDGLIGELAASKNACINLAANVAYFLAHPESLPEDWTIQRSTPSPAAERKRAKVEHRPVRHLPGTLWALGAPRPLYRPPHDPEERPMVAGGHRDAPQFRWGVQTWRAAHYHWYRVGKGRTGWRLKFLAPARCGPEDAPLSVHATRLLREIG